MRDQLWRCVNIPGAIRVSADFNGVTGGTCGVLLRLGAKYAVAKFGDNAPQKYPIVMLEPADDIAAQRFRRQCGYVR